MFFFLWITPWILDFYLKTFSVDVCFILRCLHSLGKKEVKLCKRCLLEFVYNILVFFFFSSKYQNWHLKNALNSFSGKVLCNVNIIYLFSQVQIKPARYSYKEGSLCHVCWNERLLWCFYFVILQIFFLSNFKLLGLSY